MYQYISPSIYNYLSIPVYQATLYYHYNDKVLPIHNRSFSINDFLYKYKKTKQIIVYSCSVIHVIYLRTLAKNRNAKEKKLRRNIWCGDNII